MDEQHAVEFPVHWISKDARYKLIELMLSTRSVTELARELGVSPTAVRKYLKRVSHPSDEILARALKVLAPYEFEAALEIITSDLLNALKKLYLSVDDAHREKLSRMIREAIG